MIPSVVVVVPVYKPTLSAYEEISLDNCLRVLSDYPIVLVAPDALDLRAYRALAGSRCLKEARFPDAYFTDIRAYNRLLLSSAFYGRFLSYHHLLIHQLDAFVFEDQLQRFCATPFDYFGAPWPRGYLERKVLEHPLSKVILSHRRRVGNGGLSLRRIATHYRLAHNLGWLSRFWPLNEDVYWSLFVGRYVPGYRVAPLKWAEAFASEQEPAVSYGARGGTLPFGCHAWEKHDPDFWRPFFNERGHRF